MAWSWRKALILWSFPFFAMTANVDTSTSEGFKDPVFKCWIPAWHPNFHSVQKHMTPKFPCLNELTASATIPNWVIIRNTFCTRFMYKLVIFLPQYSAFCSEAPARSGLLIESFFQQQCLSKRHLTMKQLPLRPNNSFWINVHPNRSVTSWFSSNSRQIPRNCKIWDHFVHAFQCKNSHTSKSKK